MAVHEDYDLLLQDAIVDAIYIPLPNHLHMQWARKAIEAGKHVLCEKPIALQADEIDELIDLRDTWSALSRSLYDCASPTVATR